MTNRRFKAVGFVAVLAGLGSFAIVGRYNELVRLGADVRAEWGQVENVYQRRADLAPALVAAVKGAAKLEQETLTAVTEARARAGQVFGTVAQDPRALRQFEQAQDQLGAALARLLVVSERYPTLTATASFRDLQAQLEGTENRIAVERSRYNDAAREFNRTRETFPTALVAGFFGERFAEKAYFEGQAGVSAPPRVAL
jgi:LemA protein